MHWHLATSHPATELDRTRCLLKTLSGQYLIADWVQNIGSFCIGNDLIEVELEKWCYIDEDDTTTDELYALLAIKSATQHVSALIATLLTDGYSCGKEYRDTIGLDDLSSFQKKVQKRIEVLEST